MINQRRAAHLADQPRLHVVVPLGFYALFTRLVFYTADLMANVMSR
jgi:hypothetical protein